MNAMRSVFSIVLACMLLSACNVVYKQPIFQGNLLEKTNVDQLKVGMDRKQVYTLLGTPSVEDPFHQNRWDYIYNYVPGTYARKAKLPASSGQHLRVYFDDQNTVSKIEGLESIPVSQPGLPSSKEAILTAPPL